MKDRIHEGYGIKVNGKIFHVNPDPSAFASTPFTVIEAPASKVRRLMEAVKDRIYWEGEVDKASKSAARLPATGAQVYYRECLDRHHLARLEENAAYAALQETEKP